MEARMTAQLANLEAIVAALTKGPRHRADEIPTVENEGIYALFINDLSVLPCLAVDESNLLYIGMSESSLNERNHFFHTDSSFSSPRRSLGALLKKSSRLHLEALPRRSGVRARGISRKDISNYRFDEKGETDLTVWMRQNLTYTNVGLDEDIRQTEASLIRLLNPPLNLTLSKNESRFVVRLARKECRDQAKARCS